MFEFFKKEKKEEWHKLSPEYNGGESAAEIMGLKEYISVDNVKSYLVDTLEENRRLKERIDSMETRNTKELKNEREKKEVALIEADEWKRRAKEKEQELNKREKTIEECEKTIEKLKKERNDAEIEHFNAMTELQTAKETLEKAESELEEMKDALRDFPEGWEKTQKSTIINAIKQIMEDFNIETKVEA